MPSIARCAIADYGSGLVDPSYGDPGDTFYNTTIKHTRVFSAAANAWVDGSAESEADYDAADADASAAAAAASAIVAQTAAAAALAAAASSGGGSGGGTNSGATSATASIALSGHRAVMQLSDGTLAYDDSTVLANRYAPPGITTGATAQGAVANIVVFGYVIEPSWTWAPDLPIYLGPNGMLTQIVPTLDAGDVFRLQLAVAITPTMILWAPQAPITIA